jgi:hypothetical protein
LFKNLLTVFLDLQLAVLEQQVLQVLQPDL